MDVTQMNPDKETTRRGLVKTVVAGGATAMAPSFVSVASAETASGNVELETTTTIPTNTSVEVTVSEDTGSALTQETQTLSGGTGEVTEFYNLDGKENDDYTYWIEFSLSTSDDTVTPEIDSATLTLPAQDQTGSTPTATEEPPGRVDSPDNPQGLGELWNNYRAFVAAVVLAFAGIGMWSRSLTLASFVSYLAFLYIAITTQTPLFRNIAYVTLVLVFLGFAFKLWRLEFGGE